MLPMLLKMDAVYLEDKYDAIREEQKRQGRQSKKGAGRRREVIAKTGR